MSTTDLDVKMKILLAAKRLFAKQGFDGTSVRQICEEAGANVALVSYHFHGKENLFVELFKTFFPGNDLQKYEPYLQDPIIGITKLIEEVLRFKMDDPELATIIQQEFATQSPRIDAISQFIFPVWMKLRELLEKGRRMGVFHFRSIDNTMFFVLGTLLFQKNSEHFQPIMSEDTPTFESTYSDAEIFILRGLGAANQVTDGSQNN